MCIRDRGRICLASLVLAGLSRAGIEELKEPRWLALAISYLRRPV